MGSPILPNCYIAMHLYQRGAHCILWGGVLSHENCARKLCTFALLGLYINTPGTNLSGPGRAAPFCPPPACHLPLFAGLPVLVLIRRPLAHRNSFLPLVAMAKLRCMVVLHFATAIKDLTLCKALSGLDRV